PAEPPRTCSTRAGSAGHARGPASQAPPLAPGLEPSLRVRPWASTPHPPSSTGLPARSTQSQPPPTGRGRGLHVVGGGGFEPPTSSVSGKRSPPELTARVARGRHSNGPTSRRTRARRG